MFKHSLYIAIMFLFVACGEFHSTTKKEVPTGDVPSENVTVTVSGKITYDSVPFKSGLNSGLDYSNISKKAVRGALVEIVNVMHQENYLLQQRLMPLVPTLSLLQEEVPKYVFWLS